MWWLTGIPHSADVSSLPPACRNPNTSLRGAWKLGCVCYVQGWLLWGMEETLWQHDMGEIVPPGLGTIDQ